MLGAKTKGVQLGAMTSGVQHGAVTNDVQLTALKLMKYSLVLWQMVYSWCYDQWYMQLGAMADGVQLVLWPMVCNLVRWLMICSSVLWLRRFSLVLWLIVSNMLLWLIICSLVLLPMMHSLSYHKWSTVTQWSRGVANNIQLARLRHIM